MKRILFFFSVLFICNSFLYSQNYGIVYGQVKDDNNQPLAGATIIELSSKTGISSDDTGHFQINVPAGDIISLEFSFIGFKKDTLFLSVNKGERIEAIIKLKTLAKSLDEVVVESIYDKAETLQRINIKSVTHVPTPSGNIESFLSSVGVATRNEMSSQYSVRGGNFDENLIYVNGFEIYRPMLVKAGQQEGMSFINSDLVSSVQFAAGGFDARYGDKLSSVLDIKYKRPQKFGGSTSVSLLGTTIHIEGTGLNQKFRHITGFRYKSNKYLINSMQTQGDFSPRFFDFQTYITYDLSKSFVLSFLGNASVNKYIVIPKSRETSFGTLLQPMNFTVYYEGKEKDKFSTLFGAAGIEYNKSERLSLKLTGSYFNTFESITYDILSQYRIDFLDNTPGSPAADDSLLNIGFGGQLDHARDYLNGNVFNISHSGSYRWLNSVSDWGFSIQSEVFEDKLKEWELIDSAGYSIPYSSNTLELQNVVSSKNKIRSARFFAFFNNILTIKQGQTEILFNTGVRFNYLNSNKQFLVSPRFGVYVIPDWRNNMSFHVAIGWYHQPPLYKELIDPEGNLYINTKAQESVHFLIGSTLDLKLWERPFRFSTELYFKKMDHLVPYVIDDVDVQYLPQYSAKGYATGIEFKINGEFVKDAESWASLSFLQTYENRDNDEYGSYPRPTNQFINFGMYFQDYFPYNPSFRVHLNVYFGSRLPYYSRNYENPEDYYKLQFYRRVDIGLSKSLLTNRNGIHKSAGFVNDLWFSIEIFNLFGFYNEASFQWVRTISNQEGVPNTFAVPNYLTGRLLNFKLMVEF